MSITFVAGSISIRRIDKAFRKRIEDLATSKNEIVVGDADGSDAAIQNILLSQGASNVTVFCSGDEPRNNVGRWPVHFVSTSHKPGTREFFTAKDYEMARVAEEGLMIWDGKSTGTLSNIIELIRDDKTVAVFINKAKEFVDVADAAELQFLVSFMSSDAREKAEDKIKLSTKVDQLNRKQFALCL